MNGLIKAGYEETSLDYYKIIKENRLNGNEIKDSILNKKVSGKVAGFPKLRWSSSRNDQGEFEYTHPFWGTFKGNSWVEGDELCYQLESFFDGIKWCAEIYKNPQGNENGLDEYLALTDFWIFPFSIKETASQDISQEKEVSATIMNISNVAVDLKGEWDTVYDFKAYGVSQDVVQITQTGNTFVGIKLIGTQFSPKGSETIKGDVEGNRIKSMFLKTTQGWMPAEWLVNETGDEIFLKVENIGLTVDVKLTRK